MLICDLSVKGEDGEFLEVKREMVDLVRVVE